MPDFTRFLTLSEVLLVIDDLHRRARRSRNSQLNLVVFRFACCCGLRRSEIAGLRFSDLVLSGARPSVRVRKDNTKGREGKCRARKAPLWWDAGTLEDIREWVAFRKWIGAKPADTVLCGVCEKNLGKPLTGPMVAKHWKTAIRCLGAERVRQVSVHAGRHSFASLAFDAGRSAVEVQEALGHTSINTTSVYLHACPRDVPDLFTRESAA